MRPRLFERPPCADGKTGWKAKKGPKNADVTSVSEGVVEGASEAHLERGSSRKRTLPRGKYTFQS